MHWPERPPKTPDYNQKQEGPIRFCKKASKRVSTVLETVLWIDENNITCTRMMGRAHDPKKITSSSRADVC